MVSLSEQVDRQRAGSGIAPGRGRGVLHGLRGRSGASLAPHRIAGVSGRPTALFRTVEVASLPGLERAAAAGIGAASHGTTVAEWNQTLATSERGETLYFRHLNQPDGLWKSVAGARDPRPAAKYGH